MEIPIYIGVDVGATSMTTVALDESGTLLEARRGEGVNPFTAGSGLTVEDAVGDAIQWVVAGSGEPIDRVVVGMAGSIARPDVARELARRARSLGDDVEVDVVHDSETMFASGTLASDGHCLAVGTGAVGAGIRDKRLAWKVDGYGWLLGDRGSAVWIGLAGIRAVLGALDEREPPTSLVEDIPRLLGQLTGSPCLPDAASIVVAANRLPPAMLGHIAPHVDRHARQGDDRSRRLLEAAAAELGETLRAVIRDDADLPIVLGGSVISENRFIRGRLEDLVGDEWPNVPLHVVRGGATGAAFRALEKAGRVIPPGALLVARQLLDATQETFVLDDLKRN